MIEPTDEMAEAGWAALPVSAQESGDIDLSDMSVVLRAVLAIVERDWNMQPRPEGSRLPPTTAPSNPWAPIVDPCTGCGCAKADHREQGCIGDFMHCPCQTWMPLDESSAP